MANLYDYLEAGFRIFGLHGADSDGNCLCGSPDCQAPFKHPVISNWQSVPDWSDEQIETFEQMGHFRTGFGVLCSGWLIIDVDARNGGVESFKRLVADLPEAGSSEFVVNTGSGNGSQHHYFRLSEPVAMVQHHNDYPGIDFKTSGYVVGCGSIHASGMTYDAERGNPCNVGEAPQAIIDLLKKPDFHRVEWSGGAVDVNDEHIAHLLSHISPNCGYEQWSKVGMSIHHALGGSGFDLWDEWSAGGSDYPGTERLDRHWQSFGKNPNPAGYGTLIHYAKEGGYCEDVTFVYDGPEYDDVDAMDTTGIDLRRPPGFVGELAQWINDQCLYPRENMAVAAALTAVSGLAGMRFHDEMDGMTPNMIAFCVAGSGTGKEAIQQAYLSIMRAAQIQAAIHGGFKSEQELLRNLIRHQAAFYSVDELGIVLRKLENASKRGGASYLEGLIGLVMSVYSKANGYLPITGDLKEEIREHLRRELSKAEKQKDDLPADSSADSKRDRIQAVCDRLTEALKKIDDGLENPYLTIIGYTTPVTFNDLMGFEQATNGFMARAMIFDDLETNPKRKRGFKKRPMSDGLKSRIQNLYAPGVFDMVAGAERVEFVGESTGIPTTNEGKELLDQVYEYFHELAEDHKGKTGMEAIPRRGYEIAAKASLILALPEGVRTEEHIRWGFALAKRDVDRKIKLAYSSDKGEQADGLAAKVLSLVDSEHGETLGVICNRLRSTPKEQVKTLLDQMVKNGMLREEVSQHPRSKKEVLRFYAA